MENFPGGELFAILVNLRNPLKSPHSPWAFSRDLCTRRNPSVLTISRCELPWELEGIVDAVWRCDKTRILQSHLPHVQSSGAKTYPEQRLFSSRRESRSFAISLSSQLVCLFFFQLEEPHVDAFSFASYDKPPLYDVTIEDFETFALDRLRILAEIESSAARNRTWEETKSVTISQCQKYLPLNSNSASRLDLNSERKKDHLGHFVLRLAFCRSWVSVSSLVVGGLNPNRL
jgi:hypothetical protein